MTKSVSLASRSPAETSAPAREPESLRLMNHWRAVDDWWPREDVAPSWGPIVRDADVQRVTSDRVTELVADHVGCDPRFVGQKLRLAVARGPVRRYWLLGATSNVHAGHAVLAAVDAVVGREVALKLAPADHDLVTEAQAMARFDHPNLLRVYDVGEHGGSSFLSLDLCEQNLAQWCAQKPPWNEVLHRIMEAARGLAVVHASGLVHADIKPENILIRHGEARLGDFGCMRTTGYSAALAGTPAYIAPELESQCYSLASDIYALGVCAWKALNGSHPFGSAPKRADRAAATTYYMERARAGAFEPPSRDVPREALEVLELTRALDADPTQRPTIREFLLKLERLCASSTGNARVSRRAAVDTYREQLESQCGRYKKYRRLLALPFLRRLQVSRKLAALAALREGYPVYHARMVERGDGYQRDTTNLLRRKGGE